VPAPAVASSRGVAYESREGPWTARGTITSTHNSSREMMGRQGEVALLSAEPAPATTIAVASAE